MGSITAVAAALGIPTPTLSHHIRRRDLRAKVKAATGNPLLGSKGDRHVTSDDPREWGDIAALIRSRGLDPNDWVVVRSRVNEWGHNPETGSHYTQLRVDLEPKAITLAPARTEGWRPPEGVKAPPTKRDHELTVLVSDHHCPDHDPELHRAFCAWLKKHRPERGVLMGDVLDLSAVMRHRQDPERPQLLQTCVNSGYKVVRDYVWASPTTEWEFLPGNHDDRLRNAVIDNIVSTYGLTQAYDEDDEEPGLPLLSPRWLLRLDELGVRYIDPNGPYFKARVRLDHDMTARHGAKVAKGAGNSVRKHVDDALHSTAMGHTHRQALHYRAAWTADGDLHHLIGVEVGTMAKIKDGLGYGDDVDWAQGYATLSKWDDGDKLVELARWSDGALKWRGERWVV